MEILRSVNINAQSAHRVDSISNNPLVIYALDKKRKISKIFFCRKCIQYPFFRLRKMPEAFGCSKFIQY